MFFVMFSMIFVQKITGTGFGDEQSPIDDSVPASPKHDSPASPKHGSPARAPMRYAQMMQQKATFSPTLTPLAPGTTIVTPLPGTTVTPVQTPLLQQPATSILQTPGLVQNVNVVRAPIFQPVVQPAVTTIPVPTPLSAQVSGQSHNSNNSMAPPLPSVSAQVSGQSHISNRVGYSLLKRQKVVGKTKIWVEKYVFRLIFGVEVNFLVI